jgi:phosphoglycerol transferase MdoB-like AlkP superfamily enzyme
MKMSVMNNVWLRKLKTVQLWGLVTISLLMNLGVNSYLNVMYSRSLFPVSYFEGQLTFNAVKLTGYYSYMVERGSLHLYLHTQLFDFVFILSTLLLHGVLGLLLLRLHASRPRMRRFAIVVLIAGLAAPLFDVLENLVSFIFIANPEGIPNLLVIVASAFSACKFGLFAFTYLGVIILTIRWLWSFIANRR